MSEQSGFGLDICILVHYFPADFEKQSKHTYYMMNGLKETTFSVNSSYFVFKATVNGSLEALMNRVERIEERLTKIEDNPQSVLIEQIDAIHKEVGQ